MHVPPKPTSRSAVVDIVTACHHATEIRPDVPPQLVNGRVLVPIRVISENLGFEVSWYQDLQTVTVDRKGETYPIPLLMPGSLHLVIGGAEAHPDVLPKSSTAG